MTKKIEEIINRHLVFNRYGVLMSDDIDIECLVDNLHRLFDVEIERLEKERKQLNKHYQITIAGIEHTRIKLQRACDCAKEVDIEKAISYCKSTYEEQDNDLIDSLRILQQTLKELE